VQLRIEAHGRPSVDGDIVVVADWPARPIADASAAFSFVQSFRWIVFVLGSLGAACVYAASADPVMVGCSFTSARRVGRNWPE
jgi:hypothetical protein